MRFKDHVFREYDIRGVVGADLTAELAEAVGQAYGSELIQQRRGPDVDTAPAVRVVVGQDNRPSSPEMCDAVIRGLRASGCDVLHLGTVPTPVAYFSEYQYGAAGAVQVTGSHNPKEYNGIKMTSGTRSVHGRTIRRLAQRVRKSDFERGYGGLERVDPLPAYRRDLTGRVRLAGPLRAVVDCGNGTGSVVAVDLLEAVGMEVVPMYCESDGTFPNHHPDPTVDENVVDLISAVRREDADVGVGFDGDADRIGVVDDRGNIVRGDILLLLFGLDLLRREGPGQTLVYDVKCSQVVPEEFTRAGGSPLMWKTGHSLIKAKMKEVGALIGGELSGHICFGDDYYGFDDALYAACRLGEMLTREDRSLGEMVASLPSCFSTPEVRIEVPEAEKFDIVARAAKHFGSTHDIVTVDGVRVNFRDGWALIRASNTQPVISLRYEAKRPADLDRIRATVERWLKERRVLGDR